MPCSYCCPETLIDHPFSLALLSVDWQLNHNRAWRPTFPTSLAFDSITFTVIAVWKTELYCPSDLKRRTVTACQRCMTQKLSFSSTTPAQEFYFGRFATLGLFDKVSCKRLCSCEDIRIIVALLVATDQARIDYNHNNASPYHNKSQLAPHRSVLSNPVAPPLFPVAMLIASRRVFRVPCNMPQVV